MERASGPDFTPTLLGRPEQTWRSFVCAATKSREHMFDATAPGFDGPAGCPTQSRIRFRRLWLRFFFFLIVKRGRKNKKTKDARADARRVPGRETCPSRLNVVNTEFQLRHLIIWSSIFIHVTSESGDARVRNGLREQSVWAFGRTHHWRGRRVRRDPDPPSASSKTRE